METESTLAKEIRSADGQNARYDAVCKRILSEKILLAWIMKSCLEEYRDCDVNEIAEWYIESAPQVGMAPVAPDEAPRIHGMGNEDATLREGTVVYDIRFTAVAPISGELIRLIVNIEAQNDYYPGYPLIKRALYYCSRLISSQYGTEFTEGHYEKIKKVYSIWICSNPPGQRKNTITRYRVAEDNLVGDVKEPKANYDMLTVIMLCIGEAEDDTEDSALDLLNRLLSDKLTAEQKREMLEKEFHIKMTQRLYQEVSLMCNLSKGIEDKGIQKGIQQGIQQGIQKGKAAGKILGAIDIYREMKLSDNEILKRIMEKFSLTEKEARGYMAEAESE